MWFEWMVALRLLREARTQTLLIVVGIAVGVAVIVFLTALIGGLQASIIERTLGTQAHIRITTPEDRARPLAETSIAGRTTRSEARAQRLRSVQDWQALLRLLDAYPGVTAVSPIVSGPALARRGNARRSVALLGIELDRYLGIVPLDRALRDGQLRTSGREVLIGTVLAHDLGVGVGERIRVEIGAGRDERFTVAGIFELGVRDLDQRFVYLGLAPAQTLLDLPGGVTGIDLKVADIFAAERIAAGLRDRLGVEAESWMTTNRNILDAIAAQSASSNLIKVFVALAAAFGIASVLAVSVVQRARQIGILRAMGTRRIQIVRLFLLQGAVLGLLGSLLGSAIALSLVAFWQSAGLARSARGAFDLAVEPELFLAATLLAMLVGMLAAVLPARRAALLDPVEAIRGP